MKLEEIRLIEARSFGLGKRHGGDLEYHGKVGYFKLFTPKNPKWGEEKNLQHIVELTAAAEKASNALRKLGFKRQVHNVAIVDDKLGKNNLVANSGVAGRASDKGHGLIINRRFLSNLQSATNILTHEWGHRYWFQLTKEEQQKVEDLYDEIVVEPFVGEDTWKNIDIRLNNEWSKSLEMFAGSQLEINHRWIGEKPKADEDPKVTYLRGLKSGEIITGRVKKPIPNVAVFDEERGRIKGDTTLEMGDRVTLGLDEGLWNIIASQDLGKVRSRFLSANMVNDHIDFTPNRKVWETIQAIRKHGNIALIDKMPENTWKTIAKNAIINTMTLVPEGDLPNDLGKRVDQLLEGGLKATLDAWWAKIKPTKGKAPKDLRGVFLALKKALKEKIKIEPFEQYQKTITKKQLGTKSGNVRRQKLLKKGAVHSAYGSSNVLEFWATMVEHGASGRPLDKRVEKLLKTIGR